MSETLTLLGRGNIDSASILLAMEFIPAISNAQESSHTGIIVVPRQNYSIGAQLQGVLKLMAEKSAADLRNQLVYLSHYIATN